MAGTNRKLFFKDGQGESNSPVIILVEPQLPENIGMVARAMANFGLQDLRLVAPREVFPNAKATATASKADHVLHRTQVFSTLREACLDLHYVVATTARPRDSFKTVLNPTEAVEALQRYTDSKQKTGILFGRERWGLSNDEISLADTLVTFPVAPGFSSLNLAQAVLLMSYEWHLLDKQRLLTGSMMTSKSCFSSENTCAYETAPIKNSPLESSECLPAPKEVLYSFFDQLEQALDSRGYFRPKERKSVMIQNLRTVLTRPGFTDGEIRLLRGVISSLDRFSRQWPRGSAAPLSGKKTATNVSE